MTTIDLDAPYHDPAGTFPSPRDAAADLIANATGAYRKRVADVIRGASGSYRAYWQAVYDLLPVTK